jgi:two-component system, chemotaxis family, protein-glutamate methylesterase/glutaminase
MPKTGASGASTHPTTGDRPEGGRRPMIRVLVAEDSETARALLVSILGSDPEIEVVGQARDGVEAVELAQRLRPDVVTMDILMPRMDGLAATEEIMITAPTRIVIVTASGAQGARADEVEGSFEMLRLGALDVLMKPPGPESPGFQRARRRLVSSVKAMSEVKVVRRWRLTAPSKLDLGAEPAGSGTRASTVAIAASTGGPPALHRLLSGLPSNFEAPVLVVQHITPGFAKGLAAWLDGVGPLRVKLAEEGEPLAPRTVYLAPDDRHLGVSDDLRVGLSDAGPIGGFRPSATFLFESVARVFGPSALAVILTGMGDDGVRGLRSVRRSGGRVIAQDELSSAVYGMPAAAIKAGVADVVLPIEEIPARLVALTRMSNHA